MKVRNLDECFKFRLLRKISPDKGKSKRSLEISEKKLFSAKKGFNLGLFDYTIMEAYTSMFHAARSLLYLDGIQEKSHYAISIYLKEKYSNKIPLPIINLLEIHRTERHETVYGLDFESEKEDAEVAIKDAESFLRAIKKILPK